MHSSKKAAQSRFHEFFLNSLNEFALSGEFESSTLFDHWFRKQGKAYFFLFKKNLHVTNIQFGELIALIRKHLSLQGETEAPYLRFMSPNEFRWSMKRLQETFELKSAKDREYVAGVYAQQFGQTAVLDVFFCSCALYLPPLLDIDLGHVCGESGYVHSCGLNLLTKEIYETRECDLEVALDRFLDGVRDQRKRFFAIYAREDWPTGSETLAKMLQDGLEQVKIPVGKYFMGEQRLHAVLESLRSKYPRIFFAEPGRLDKSHDEFRQLANCETGRTIFLISDQKVGDDPKYPGDLRYYICYEQHYINENPFHIFDEDKPAWIDHTTIPHTLAGAMINITRSSWPKRTVTICDPFCGTGTLWFEAAKFLPEVVVSCSDLSPAAQQLAKDNLKFFSVNPETLKMFRKKVSDSMELSRERYRREHEPMGPEFNEAQTLSRKWLEVFDTDDYSKQKELMSKIDKEDFAVRLLFYLILKTTRRHSVAMDTQAWWEFYLKEAGNHQEALRILVRQKERTGTGERGSQMIALGKGVFSASCFLDVGARPKEPFVENERDALSLGDHFGRNIDVIITDPPYGFNKREDRKGLCELYEKMIPTFLSVLSDDSQLVIAIPEWSHTGRQLPAFTYKEFLTHKVLLSAAECGMEVVWQPSAVPIRTRSLFRAPFYWESERALRRSILHFRFLRRKSKLKANGPIKPQVNEA